MKAPTTPQGMYPPSIAQALPPPYIDNMSNEVPKGPPPRSEPFAGGMPHGGQVSPRPVHNPSGSVAASGLFETYAYRFQLCGSVKLTAAIPTGSGEIQRP